ncbi:Hypothetical protein SMAX5B_018245 [Scophthalmus maximus]|uniref:Uncharacterized protein n=1 Tax=Scophthalmus maximus TaxID=52904 RepID=A0A2U9CA05_SCOMX|nr:Hypothetical protein SMAX5B_018245 [Scophthalmus maximus]
MLFYLGRFDLQTDQSRALGDNVWKAAGGSVWPAIALLVVTTTSGRVEVNNVD